MNPAAQPVANADNEGDCRWMSQHLRYIAESKDKEPDVVFIGDSIIQRLAHTEVWREMFEPLHCLNFGIGGDTTCNLLWRIQSGVLDSVTTKIVVLMVGTNNLRFEAEDTVVGVIAVVDAIQNKQPLANVIVMSLLPRGERPNLLRDKNQCINKLLGEELDSWPMVTFLQHDDTLFVNAHDESISSLDMFDYLHLTRRGYQKLCEPLLDAIQTLLQSFGTSGDSASLAGQLASDN